MPSTSGLAGRPSSRLRVVSPGVELRDDDASLVASARAGAPAAAGRLWDRYSVLVRRILRRILGPAGEVEDGVQDAFLRLFRDLHSLRDPSALRSFIIGITLHVAKSELRRRRARRWLLLSDDGVLAEVATFAGDGHGLDSRAALVRLYRVLDRVGHERRVAFVLRYVEGLELAELSVILGCSLATTKRRVAEAARRVSLLAQGDPLLAPYLQGRP
ncbi:MAG TPA: RNA polymerase sigma factor [Polyangiaceae bacterium]|jgi:RNA polymerase sigma-70 factor (ECF subfamily)|nr:RNA polymerase sigma factor [Polyangiaceae bacterium]